MFTGIVEKSSRIIETSKLDDSVFRISIIKPESFDDLKNGDSICVNGVCLTVINFTDKLMDFDLGPETLQVTGWTMESLKNSQVNLERSMKFGDRIHGHFLSGHVDEVGEITASYSDGNAWFINVLLTDQSKNFVWKKGSIGLSGVSLTVNNYYENTVSVCLIPETIKLTNLSDFKVGDKINIEYDWMAKAFYNQAKNWNLNLKEKNESAT